MITDGWINWASRRPGPVEKVYEKANAGAGIVFHSMEGWFSGSMAELDKLSRQASWMFSIDLEGNCFQHYPVSASCWASGNWLANTSWWSVELEGTYAMPINDDQLAEAIRLVWEWSAWRGVAPSRSGDQKNMWEHREVATIATPNAGPTSCPSERYQRLWAALEDDMTAEERQEHQALVAIFGGREKLLQAQAQGMDYLLGYAIEQADQDKLEALVAKLQETEQGKTVAPHAHRTKQVTITTGEVIQS